MIRSYHGWLRVSKLNPCPVCGSFDWCLVSEDGSAAICPRTSDGAHRDLGDAGFLHRIDPSRGGGRHGRMVRLKLREPNGPQNHIAAMSEYFVRSVTLADIDRFADGLGLTPASLRRLQVGWSITHRAWSFPMRDANGTVVGLRLRSENGRKFSVSGGHHGLHVPTGLGNPEQLLLAEGPTDCAAMLDLGFAAVGRPSCTGATEITIELARKLRPKLAVIMADNDPPKTGGRRPGIDGAVQLATSLALHVQAVKVIVPPVPIKDARAWKIAGATADDVTAVINAVAPMRLSMCREVP